MCLGIQVPAGITTLMVRRVPRKYSEAMLLADFEALVAFPDFDFFFLPWEVKRNLNSGFAFINFRSAAAAQKFTDSVHNRAWPSNAAKFIEVSAACVQGLVPNLVNLVGNAKVEEWPRHAPLVLHGGRRLTFQEAVDLLVPKPLLARVAEAVTEVDVCRAPRQQAPPESAVPVTVLAKVGAWADESAAVIHAPDFRAARHGKVLQSIELSAKTYHGKAAFRPPPGLLLRNIVGSQLVRL